MSKIQEKRDILIRNWNHVHARLNNFSKKISLKNNYAYKMYRTHIYAGNLNNFLCKKGGNVPSLIRPIKQFTKIHIFDWFFFALLHLFLLILMQVESIGTFFMKLLRESKHRGAFELAYAGFIKLSTRIWR